MYTPPDLYEKKKKRKENLLRLASVGGFFALSVCLYFVIVKGPLRPYVVPPIEKLLLTNLKFLADLLWYFFIICCLFLCILIFLLELERRKLKIPWSEYRSMVVAPDYYRGVKRVDYYRAIRTALSKYGRDTDERVEGSDKKKEVVQQNLHRDKKFWDKLKSWEQKTGERATYVEVPEEAYQKMDGTYKKFYPTGNLEKEINYKSGELNGVAKYYYEDGSLHIERNYKNGRLEGPFKAYDEYGVLYFEMTYKAGRKNGLEKAYYPSGVIHYIENYIDGEKISRKTFDETGQLKFDHTYIDDDELQRRFKTRNE